MLTQFLLTLCAEAPSAEMADALAGLPPPKPPAAAPAPEPGVPPRPPSVASSTSSRLDAAAPPAAAATPVHRVSLFQQPSQTPVATIDLFSDQLPTAKDAD